MFDSNWDLINGDDAHSIEVLNQSSVANLIEALVKYLQHHDSTPGHACEICPDQAMLREMHRTGTLLLLQKPGAYRDCEVHVIRRDRTVYQPPLAADVWRHMASFEQSMRALWPTADKVTVAAYALWRINWIHPFKNGNGRTARAFAYACVCLKHGSMLPGTVTMIDLITRSRDDYEAALAHADKSHSINGTADLKPLEAYVDGLLRAQILSALEVSANQDAPASAAS